jgi:ABC-type polysaccharide/polyol phosphate export permease
MVLVFGILYGSLMDREISRHLPYVAAGLIVWILYSEILIQGCNALIRNGRLIQQMPLPYSVYVLRTTSQVFINFLHNSIIIVAVFVIFPESFGASTWLICLLGLCLIIINGLTFSFIFSIVSLRFRDFPPVVSAVMRPMLFLTPIIWDASMFSDRAAFILINPFYHIIEIFRAPLLGQQPAMLSWMFVIAITLLGCLVVVVLFSRYRHRIAYWV